MNIAEDIGVIICTHNRVLDAKINQEIIRYHWTQEAFEKITIIHSYNGQRDWYPQQYLEDDLLRSNNSTLSQGNADLIDNGIKYLSQQYPDIKYAIVLNADTWILKPNYIRNCLEKMIQNNYYLAGSSYTGDKTEFFRGGIASDFFIVNIPFAINHKMFPLNYKEFQEHYWDLILYYCGDMSPILEKLLLAKFSKALIDAMPTQNPADNFHKKLLRLREREPFYRQDSDTERIWHWSEAGVISDHDIESKIKILKENNITQGKFIRESLKPISFKLS